MTEIHHRKSIRLKGYDYSQPGDYFVTINIADIRCMLAVWTTGTLKLTPAGEIVKKYWLEIPLHYPDAKLDEFVVMPDHLHGIINIENNIEMAVGVRHGEPLQQNEKITMHCHGEPLQYGKKTTSRVSHQFQNIIPHSIGSIVNQFKGAVTRWCKTNGYPQFKWQRNFYEHIIRSEDEVQRIRRYIRNNPDALLEEFPALGG